MLKLLCPTCGSAAVCHDLDCSRLVSRSGLCRRSAPCQPGYRGEMVDWRKREQEQFAGFRRCPRIWSRLSIQPSKAKVESGARQRPLSRARVCSYRPKGRALREDRPETIQRIAVGVTRIDEGLTVASDGLPNLGPIKTPHNGHLNLDLPIRSFTGPPSNSHSMRRSPSR